MNFKGILKALLRFLEACDRIWEPTLPCNVCTVNYLLSKATWSEDRMGVVGVLGELVVW